MIKLYVDNISIRHRLIQIQIQIRSLGINLIKFELFVGDMNRIESNENTLF